MKVVIFEGPDNLGKSTIIREIEKTYKDQYEIHKYHCTGPICTPGEDPFDAQCRQFLKLTSDLLKLNKKNPNTMAIIDRSWIGEYVYGQIYRNGTPEKIIRMINGCNKQLADAGIMSVFIQLTASAEFVISHDDNLSFTSGYDTEKRLATVNKEITLFSEAFEKMKTFGSVKATVKVQNADTNNYRLITDIFNEINSVL